MLLLTSACVCLLHILEWLPLILNAIKGLTLLRSPHPSADPQVENHCLKVSDCVV